MPDWLWSILRIFIGILVGFSGLVVLVAPVIMVYNLLFGDKETDIDKAIKIVYVQAKDKTNDY